MVHDWSTMVPTDSTVVNFLLARSAFTDWDEVPTQHIIELHAWTLVWFLIPGLWVWTSFNRFPSLLRTVFSMPTNQACEIVFLCECMFVCMYTCMHVCLSFRTHVSKALEAKSSLYTRYIEPVLNLSAGEFWFKAGNMCQFEIQVKQVCKSSESVSKGLYECKTM